MKYLITGGAGFIGSHLCKTCLQYENNQVVVLDNLTTGSYDNISHLTYHKERFSFVCGDVCDKQLVQSLVKEADVVYHLASSVGVKLIMDKPISTITNIINGTQTVLQMCCKYWKPLLITSTSEVYGKSQKFPFEEDDDTIMGNTQKHRWAYAFSKAIDQFLAFAYYKERKMPVIVVRLFNTTGPRQTGQYGMVVPKFIKNALEGKDLIVHGDGTQKRCFTHVDDAVNALYRLLPNKTAYGQLFNIGSYNQISILDLAKKIIRITNSNSNIKFITYEQAYGQGFQDMKRRVPSIEKIKKHLGYQPQKTIDDIIQDIVIDLRF